MRAKAIIRDTLIIFALTFLSGFVVGLSGAQGPSYQLGIAAGNVVFSAVGFAISGALAKTDRFQHLYYVATAVWLGSLVNVAFMRASLFQWAFSLLSILIAMVVGGAISFLFVRQPKPVADDLQQS